MGIVELNGDRVGELLPGLLALFEAADNIVERGSAPEVLLLQAELFTALEAGKCQSRVGQYLERTYLSLG
jgi:hypothetical protein